MENNIQKFFYKIKKEIKNILPFKILTLDNSFEPIINIKQNLNDIIIIIATNVPFEIKPIIELLKNNGFYIKYSNFPEDSTISSFTYYEIICTLHKNLLIIGNGFDLAHKFRTSYTDFLNYCNVKADITGKIYINNNLYNIKNNAFFKYLNNIKNKRGYWIDVETAISDIVKYIENINKTFIEDKSYSFKELTNLLGKNYLQFTQVFSPQIRIKGTIYKYKITTKKFNNSLRKLENDLDLFTKALEDYLIIIEEDDIYFEKNTLKDIKNIQEKITHVLSFNYTDTFRILYTKNISDNYIDFIHGQLRKHNLVLGISETLPIKEENIELSCMYFKKYFQRIFKKTGAKYADWLDNKNGTNFDTVYIYGHSLDITDKEILSRIINDINHIKKIVIFYYNEVHYRQEISNLVKILDKNIFLKYVAEHRIEFKEQSS